jgi:hypothetical protein
MYARTSYSADEFPSYVIPESDVDFASGDFYAGEPVCPPSPRGIEIVPYTYLFLLLAAVVGCAFAADPETREDWTSKIERVASSMTEQEQSASPIAPMPAKTVASADTPASIAMPPPAVPVAAEVAPPLPQVTIANAPGDKDDDADDNAGTSKSSGKTSVSDAYAPPRPSNDPYRRKAEAVGLHPDLSRAVLTHLTATDYRNAAFAIEKAIRTVRNDGEFTWPRARKPGVAVFNVHFVEGAPHDCRRYVVTVTKDRWTSTALPMEKCGVKVAYRGGREKTIE